jgi:hypothetical protein
MKKLFAFLIITTLLLSSLLVVAVYAKPDGVKKAVLVQRIDSYVKPDGVGKPPKDSEPELYAFLGKNIKWASPVALTFAINPTGNLDGLNYNFVYDTVFASAHTWDEEVDETLFVSYSKNETVGSVYSDAKRDNVNTVFFADLPYEGAIAVCIVYYINVGPPSQRATLEFDMVFDADLVFYDNAGVEYDFSWGDVSLNTAVMDLQNIATHEFGHSLGLADLYDETPPVPEQTMYGLASAGEIKKRDLASGDQAGIKALYG